MRTVHASPLSIRVLIALHTSQRARRVAALARLTTNDFRRALWLENGRTL